MQCIDGSELVSRLNQNIIQLLDIKFQINSQTKSIIIALGGHYFEAKKKRKDSY